MKPVPCLGCGELGQDYSDCSLPGFRVQLCAPCWNAWRDGFGPAVVTADLTAEQVAVKLDAWLETRGAA